MKFFFKILVITLPGLLIGAWIFFTAWELLLDQYTGWQFLGFTIFVLPVAFLSVYFLYVRRKLTAKPLEVFLVSLFGPWFITHPLMIVYVLSPKISVSFLSYSSPLVFLFGCYLLIIVSILSFFYILEWYRVYTKRSAYSFFLLCGALMCSVYVVGYVVIPPSAHDICREHIQRGMAEEQVLEVLYSPLNTHKIAIRDLPDRDDTRRMYVFPDRGQPQCAVSIGGSAWGEDEGTVINISFWSGL